MYLDAPEAHKILSLPKWPDLIGEDEVDIEKAYASMEENFTAHEAFGRNYFAWIASTLRPYLGRRTLELGAGCGHLAAHLTDLELLVVSDTREPFLKALSELARGRDVQVERLDANCLRDHIERIRAMRLDSIYTSNVIEHIRDDIGAMAQMAEAVGPGGRVVTFVPALRSLYGSVDRGLGHFRRYEREELEEKMRAAGLRVETVDFFNMPGCAAWFLVNRLLGRENTSKGQIRAFNQFVPLFRALESVVKPPIGASLIGAGRAG